MSQEHQSHHPTVMTYIQIAVILGILTALEFAIVEYEVAWLSSGAVLFWLYAMSIAKFVLVILFFMHLKFDSPMLTGLFTSGLIIGTGTLGALLLAFFFFHEDTDALEASAGLVTAAMDTHAPEEADRNVPIVVDWGGGEEVYNANCASCHQANGQGVPGAFPQLTVHAPSLVLAEGGREYMAQLLLYGLQGEIQVLDQTYNGVMPAWSQLGNEEIADTINYVIAAWGNGQLLPNDFEAITPEEIEAQRGLGWDMQQVHAARQGLDIIEVSDVGVEEAGAQDVDLLAEETAATGATAAAEPSWDWVDLGDQVYTANCASCHQANGQGIAGAFPPLVGHTPDLYAAEGGREYLIDVLLYGLQGEIEVEGETYNGVMPAWQQLADEEIAAVINHTLTDWGNQDLLPPDWNDLEPGEIEAERGKGWSPAEVHDQRQALEVVEAAAPEAAPAEEAPAAVSPVAGSIEGGVYTLSLSPDELADSNTLTITMVDAEGNSHTTTLQLEEGVSGVEVLAGPEGVPVAPEPAPAAPDESLGTEDEPAVAPAEAEPVQIQVRPFEPAPDEAVADPAQLEVLLQSVEVLAQAVETLTQTVDTLSERAAEPPTVAGAEAVSAPRVLELAPLTPVQALAPGVEGEEALARRGEVRDPELILTPEPPDLMPEAPGETGEAAEPAPAPPIAPPIAPPAATVRPAVADEDLLARGRQVYGAACVRCHLPDGQGREDIASLRDNAVVQGEVSGLVRIPVSGHGNIPSIITLTDGDMAAVLSYLRASFGNDAGPVGEDEVAQVSALGR